MRERMKAQTRRMGGELEALTGLMAECANDAEEEAKEKAGEPIAGDPSESDLASIFGKLAEGRAQYMALISPCHASCVSSSGKSPL